MKRGGDKGGGMGKVRREGRGRRGGKGRKERESKRAWV